MMFALALTSGCYRWTRTDAALELASQASLAADWVSTDRGLQVHMREVNPLVGPHGEHVVIYFPAIAVLHMAVSACLPPHLRKVWQGLTVAVQAGTVYGNEVRIKAFKETYGLR